MSTIQTFPSMRRFSDCDESKMQIEGVTMKNFLKVFSAIISMAIFFTISPAHAFASAKDIATYCEFSEAQLNDNYNFSKLKRVFVLDTDTSALVDLEFSPGYFTEANKTNAKKMKCKLVDKANADALVSIKLKKWENKFDHRDPERTVYVAYKHYEGYKDIEKDETRTYRDPKTGKMISRRAKVRRRRWTTSSSWFFGAKEVVSPYPLNSNSRKITSSTPFENSRPEIIPARDVYISTVTALFEIRDAKTDNLLLSCEGTVSEWARNYQMKLYEGLCYGFFKDYKKIIKSHQKLKKHND